MTEQKEQGGDRQGGDSNKILLPAAVILAGLFIGGVLYWNHSHPYSGQVPTTTVGKGGFGNEASIQKLTKGIAGIDEAKVTAAVKAKKSEYKKAIDADRTEAAKYGINATPSFIIGTTIVPGAQPYAKFEEALNAPVDPKSTTNVKNVITAGLPFLGKSDAPQTIAFWSDFQCPYCKMFELGTLPQIIQNYVDTGKVKVIFKDLSFLGPDSDTAAIYSRAVWELYPQQYFAWRTAMYEAQDGENDSL